MAHLIGAWNVGMAAYRSTKRPTKPASFGCRCCWRPCWSEASGCSRCPCRTMTPNRSAVRHVTVGGLTSDLLFELIYQLVAVFWGGYPLPLSPGLLESKS